MHVGEYCNREVVIATRKTGIREAARLMRQYHVGDLVVTERVDEQQRPVGIVTDRDLVVEVLAQDAPLEQLRLEDIMRSPLQTAKEYDDVLDTLRRMRVAGVRRIPVVDEHGGLAGIFAVDDLLGLMAGSLNEVVSLVAREIRTEEKQRP